MKILVVHSLLDYLYILYHLAFEHCNRYHKGMYILYTATVRLCTGCHEILCLKVVCKHYNWIRNISALQILA